MKILVTGGAGYIGSHTVVELLDAGHEVIVVDILSNSNAEVIKRVEQITSKTVPFYKVDLTNKKSLSKVFDEHTIDAVIHFAGLKAVGESVAQPLRYYRNNIDSTLTLCETMQERGVRRLIFSSSATVYDTTQPIPWTETTRTGVNLANPYGKTKWMIEQILNDLAVADPSWQITILRYFNPVGAHQSGLIGEDPNGIPNNLLPYVSQVALGKLDKVRVFGGDYDTPDGTCIRDYIHIVDLTKGHVAALNRPPKPGETAIYNLGTGKGVSVLEVIKAMEKASGKKIPYEIIGRRPGDIATYYADPSKANRELNWKAEKTIEDACVDAWRWQSNNPDGYRTKKSK